ncbi:hypothetical protein OBK16_00380 [Empedobacter falsenii]
MKKILFSLALVIAGLTNVNAQQGHFKVGAHVGLPTGNLSEAYSLNLGADLAYLWKINDIVELGATTGISNYFGKNIDFMGYDIEVEDVQIIPLAATAKFNIAQRFFVGADLGYAFFLGESEDTGSFYYQPKIGYDFNKSEVYLGYKGMSEDGYNVGSINLGYAYNF